MSVYDVATLRSWLPRHASTVHKYQRGSVCVVGGDRGYAGAVILAARAARLAGAGMVTVVTHPDHVMAVVQAEPTLLACALSDSRRVTQWVQSADVVLFGPGTADTPWLHQAWRRIRSLAKTWIADAAAMALVLADAEHHVVTITPHEGEAARLLGVGASHIHADRRGAALALAQIAWGTTVVLKGAGTLVAEGGECDAVSTGHPILAQAGSGDCLAGWMAGLQAQGMSARQAALLACAVHAQAGIHLAKNVSSGGVTGDQLLLACQQMMHEPE